MLTILSQPRCGSIMDEGRVIVADGGGGSSGAAFLSEHGGGASMSREGDKGGGAVMRMGHTACTSLSQRTLPLLLLLLLPSRS